MDNVARLGYLSRAKRLGRKIDNALTVIDEALSIGPSMVCASWGKDSIVLLHLVQRCQPSIPVVHVGDKNRDEIDNFSEIESDYITRFGVAEYHHLTVDIGGDSVTKAINKSCLKYPVRFLGLRTQEQGGRVYSLRQYGEIHQYQTGKQNGLWRICPLMDWVHQDIWAYITANNLPYLKFYDVYGPDARTSSVYSERLFTDDPTHGGVYAGRIARLKEYSPAFYNRLVEKSTQLGAMV